MSALAAEGAGAARAAGPGPAAAVALHPERTDDPATLRWVVAGGLPDGFEPQAVTALVPPGTLVGVRVLADQVLTTLADGRDWRAEGVAVRAAVAHAVGQARRAEAAPSDERLRAAATRIVEQEVNPYAATHGGSLRVVDVHDGEVEVAMRGACHGCPAAAFTVQGRLGRRLAGTAGFEGVRVSR